MKHLNLAQSANENRFDQIKFMGFIYILVL